MHQLNPTSDSTAAVWFTPSPQLTPTIPRSKPFRLLHAAASDAHPVKHGLLALSALDLRATHVLPLEKPPLRTPELLRGRGRVHPGMGNLCCTPTHKSRSAPAVPQFLLHPPFSIPLTDRGSAGPLRDCKESCIALHWELVVITVLYEDQIGLYHDPTL